MAQDAELELSKLRQSYRDIIWGYSITSFQKRKVIIKHFTAIDQAIIDQEREIFLIEGKEAGLLDESQAIESLKINGLWSDKLDQEISDKKAFIDLRVQTKRNLYLQSQIKETNEEISNLQKELNDLLRRRELLLGLTAEKYAFKKINELYVYNSLFLDSSFKESFFTHEEFDELSIKELEGLVDFYNNTISNYSPEKIKHIGLHDFFQNIFSICESDVFKFYGKPVCLLTYYQQEMFYYGNLFHHILQRDRDKIPPDIKKNPDKLIDYFMGNQNAKKIIDQQGGDVRSAGLVGATKEDLRALGISDQEMESSQKKYKEITKTPGKSLSMADMIKQGIIPITSK